MFTNQDSPPPQRALLFDVPESTTDTWGQPSQVAVAIPNNSASDLAFWLVVKPLSGSEILNVRQQWATATHYLECNWLADSVPISSDNPGNGIYGYVMPQMKWKLLKDARIFNVLSAINVDEANVAWRMVAQEHYGATS